jgi:hypothetical protein
VPFTTIKLGGSVFSLLIEPLDIGYIGKNDKKKIRINIKIENRFLNIKKPYTNLIGLSTEK